MAIAIGGAIASSGDGVQAQITPDNTLGAESSVVTPNVEIDSIPSDRIDGGAIRGTNLFHSFGEFNIDEGRGAYFTNPASIENILGRVTGSNPSNIFGKLGVLGSANLFLINPNGIVFGPNAQLDLGGSFVGTTASAIQFGDRGFFSASTPNAPALLTVNPSALLFNQIAAGAIVNRSTAPQEKLDPSDVFGFRQLTGLQVPDGKSLLLVGGNVSLDGGGINALGGRVELGGLADAGTVGLSFDNNILSLNFPENVARADVSLNNKAFVSVMGEGGGSIALTARNIEILGSSQLRAGIGLGLGTAGSQAGDITLNATEAIAIVQGDGNISNVSLGTGNTGDINIKTGSLSMADNAELVTLVEEEAYGDVGNISVQANGPISLEGSSQIIVWPPPPNVPGGKGNVSLQANGSISFIDSRIVTSTWGGNAGNISVTTNNSISLVDSSLGSGTYGPGNGGNISVKANGAVSLLTSTIGSGSGDPDVPAQGNAGNVYIQAQSIAIAEGTELGTKAYGSGNAGNIRLDATDFVEISGRGRFPENEHIWSPIGVYSSLLTSTEAGATGFGGDININTNSLRVKDGGIVSTRSRSAFRGGNITVNANELEVTNGGQLLTTAFSSGDAGNIVANIADRITLSGTNPAISESFKQIAAGPLVKGEYTAEDLLPQVIPSNGIPASGLFANTAPGSTGSGGSIFIDPRSAVIGDGAGIAVDSQGTGKAGNIGFDAGTLTLDRDAFISAETATNTGGDISLQVQDLLLLERSQISTTAGTAKAGGNGGNLNIDAGLYCWSRK